jgi:hypothetical protein
MLFDQHLRGLIALILVNQLNEIVLSPSLGKRLLLDRLGLVYYVKRNNFTVCLLVEVV